MGRGEHGDAGPSLFGSNQSNGRKVQRRKRQNVDMTAWGVEGQMCGGVSPGSDPARSDLDFLMVKTKTPKLKLKFFGKLENS
jgi:hypothetical protein